MSDKKTGKTDAMRAAREKAAAEAEALLAKQERCKHRRAEKKPDGSTCCADCGKILG